MQKAGMDKEAVRALLPNVGDELMRTPHMQITSLGFDRPRPQMCVVEYVNTEHMWYRVRFVDTGIVECFGAIDCIDRGVRLK